MGSDQLLWVSETPTLASRKAVHHRRSHKKSRRGCLTCKTRRVKVSGIVVLIVSLTGQSVTKYGPSARTVVSGLYHVSTIGGSNRPPKSVYLLLPTLTDSLKKSNGRRNLIVMLFQTTSSEMYLLHLRQI